MTPTHRTTRPIALTDGRTLPAGTPVEVRVWRDRSVVVGWTDPDTNAVAFAPDSLEPIAPPPPQEPVS